MFMPDCTYGPPSMMTLDNAYGTTGALLSRAFPLGFFDFQRL
jgi:hypothetical protein